MSRFRSTLTFAAALLLGAGVAPMLAQETAPLASITGRVIDEKSGQPLSEVTVQIVGQEVVGTRLAAMTGMDGRFRLVNVRPGTVTLTVRRIGYAMKNITGLYLEAGKTLEQDVSLQPGSTQLAAIVVSADRERATIAEALETQRNALGVVSAISRDQIQKSPDGDAAQAARRVAGVSIQDGKYVNARGLGDRYTTVSLNSARLPSPDPEKKVVPLDIFPSGLLDAITVSKTFTPDQPGDFSGAQVEVKTREFPADRTATYSLSSGFNSAARGNLPFAPGVGGEAFAFARSGRNLPGSIRDAGNLVGLTTNQENAMMNSLRKVWTAGSSSAQPNASGSATFGGSELVGGHQFGYIASATYSLSQDVHRDEVYAVARPGNDGETVEDSRFTGITAGTSALWGGVANLSTLIGMHSRLSLNNTFSRTSDNLARVSEGVPEEAPLLTRDQILQYVQRSVWSSQLVGERETDANRLQWSVTGAGVRRQEPDRSEFQQQLVDGAGGPQLLWNKSSADGASRTFADVKERSVESSASLQHRIGAPGNSRSIKAGLLGRMVDRNADTRAYSIFGPTLTDDRRALPPEVLFGGAYTQPDSSVLDLASQSQGGAYTANDYLGAAYGMFDGFVSDRWRLTAGARFEIDHARVNSTSTFGQLNKARHTYADVLPSVALTYIPSTQSNLRFSLTRTLARPEYRELASTLTRDVANNLDMRGNPELMRTLIDNADVRWEFYPTRGEVFSIGAFAKYFHDPIERVFFASTNRSVLGFQNAPSGTDLGVELEARAGLERIADPLSALTVFTNVTLMRSQVTLAQDNGTTATDRSRPMVGQAPYIINGGLTFAPGQGQTSATLLVNRIGDRLSAAGELPLPNAVETAHTALDFSLRFPVMRRMSGKLDARNLLDEPVIERQGSVVRHSYRSGRGLSVGLTWRQ